ncbi:YrhC family protein [Lentibacillus sp. Marseille-P4043]|uniref:YrhC family protein n=1 Tax=Lentibacillus sp. Marseille-P4043 TaxID=2040293 RepID=UPI000D0BE247|nr:YrhC family protein [Lentibacillus sp. Marseille-P4043]
MDSKTKELELKLKDYQRFIITLLIISIYLYMGAIMDTYIRPKADGGLLTGLSFGMVTAAAGLIMKYRKMKSKVRK